MGFSALKMVAVAMTFKTVFHNGVVIPKNLYIPKPEQTYRIEIWNKYH